jgi:hypothetical protein
VDEVLFVRGREPAARRDERLEHLVPGTLLLLEPIAQGVALDELQGDEHAIAERARVVHDDDVGVRDLRRRLRLAHEPRAARGRAPSLSMRARTNLIAILRSSSASYAP